MPTTRPPPVTARSSPTASRQLRPSGSGVPVAGVLLAGSRHGQVPQPVCRTLLAGLGGAGFGFLVGCAPGVDASFQQALFRSRYAGRALVGCAFCSRLHEWAGSPLAACLVAPAGLSPAAALRRRTLWLVKRCCLALLFPLDPATGRWGPGSRLVYRAALEQLKPVFIAGPERPAVPAHCRVVGSTLYGLEDWWVVPHPIYSGGPCDEEF